MSSIPIIFIWLLIVILLFRYNINKKDKELNTKRKNFLEKIDKSTSSRKKKIEDENFLSLSLTTDYINSLDISEGYKKRLLSQREKPMASFSGISNTDLMISYGAASLSDIKNYEDNLAVMQKMLYTCASELYDKGDINHSIKLLEESIKLKDSRSSSYILLGKCYDKNGNKDKKKELLQMINNSDLTLKNKILEELK